MKELKNVIGDYEGFLASIISTIENEEKFDLSDFVQLDVLCYRTQSSLSYQNAKVGLAKVGTLLVEAEISGRPIATFRLNHPIFFRQWRIDTIELPAPKNADEDIEGLEHIQFVLFDEITTFIQKYPNKTFETKGLARATNPMLTYRLSAGFSVKFHIVSLAAAIAIESNLKKSHQGSRRA